MQPSGSLEHDQHRADSSQSLDQVRNSNLVIGHAPLLAGGSDRYVQDIFGYVYSDKELLTRHCTPRDAVGSPTTAQPCRYELHWPWQLFELEGQDVTASLPDGLFGPRVSQPVTSSWHSSSAFLRTEPTYKGPPAGYCTIIFSYRRLEPQLFEG